MISPELSATIAARIEEHVAARGSDPLTEAGALPVEHTLGASFGVRTDGEVLAWNWWDESAQDQVAVVDFGPTRFAVLSFCSRRWPELRGLMPERPPDAVVCEACDGTGFGPPAPPGCLARLLGRTEPPPQYCFWCGGAGWTPRVDDTSLGAMQSPEAS